MSVDAYTVTMIDAQRLENFALSQESLGVSHLAFSESGPGYPCADVHIDGEHMRLCAGCGSRLFDESGIIDSYDMHGVSEGHVLTLRTESTHSSGQSGNPGVASLLFIRPSTAGAREFRKIAFSSDADMTIGRDGSSALVYSLPFVSEHHAVLSYRDAEFSIVDNGSVNGTFINGVRLTSGRPVHLNAGDLVQIMDLIFTVGLRFISLNNPQGVRLAQSPAWHMVSHESILAASPPAAQADDVEEAKPFYPAPRLMHTVHVKAFHVDEPPQAMKREEQPALMQLGPSFLMGIGSVFMAISAVSNLSRGGNVLSAAPSLAMAVAMVGGTLIWPMISKRYTKKVEETKERRRQDKYTDYLNSITAKLLEERDRQSSILNENRPPLQNVLQRAYDLSPHLMDRNATQADFLQLRVGMGEQRVEAQVQAPQRRFSMENDALLEQAEALADKPTMMQAPVAVDLAGPGTLGVVGARPVVWDFVRGLLAQTCSFYGYNEVKIVAIVDPADQAQWAFLKDVPHARSDDGKMRYLASDQAELLGLDSMLSKALAERDGVRGDAGKACIPFYVVVCANRELAAASSSVSKLGNLEENKGFCVLFLGDDLRDLPRECSQVIELAPPDSSQAAKADYALGTRGVLAGPSRMFDRSDVGGSERIFQPDILLSAAGIERFVLALAHARLATGRSEGAMPESLGFMEMFQKGNVLQLNIADRWKEHDSSRSLAAQVGIGAKGEPVSLDLHEEAHGPHGLIAGTTGSGKSEFIITWVLSMALNYSPDEVAFVLIDYKGGGLAGAFDNARLRLPHLAGTITNLDGAAVARSMVSIKSELKRRQALFNKACEATGEATMDIGKYISYFRQGVLSEPCPHLFVVADEFAELKQQEPTFLDELVSAARIGRSLGVHLVLATQKPTGVVSDQIASNARFRVCLKVADAADSREMIRRTDAAALTRPGEFYLLVGYDELFTGGQAAYAGGTYTERDVYEPKRDVSVELVGLDGGAVSRLRPPSAGRSGGISELNAVLEQVCEVARAVNKSARPLWLEPLPERVLLDDLRQKFDFRADHAGLTAVVGELDDPEHQRQDVFSVDVAEAGNVALYGTPTSGVESLAMSMVCSLMAEYTPDELNVYVWDMGAGSLSALSKAPHVGGVVLVEDSERVDNLFLLLEQEIAHRRRLFSRSGGSYESYNGLPAEDRDPVPRIVVVLADIAAFNEGYEKYVDRLNTLARDAPRYGIHLIITASLWSQVNMRLRASMGRTLVTSFSNNDDYNSVLNGMHGVTPPKGFLAGVFQNGKGVTVYQGASLCADPSGEVQAVRDFCGSLAAGWGGTCAKQIPVLPRHVVPSMFNTGEGYDARSIPVGYAKEGAFPVEFDGSRNAMIVSSDDGDALYGWLEGIREVLLVQKRNYVVLDATGIFSGVEDSRVLGQNDEIAEWIEGMLSGRLHADVIVIPSVVQLMVGLTGSVSDGFKAFLESERYKGAAVMILASESWRLRGVFDSWFKAVTANPNGLWIGDGFTSETVFPHTNVAEPFKRPMGPHDGVMHGTGRNTLMRLIEPDGKQEQGENGGKGRSVKS
ncbi:DNA segregation ATPase FtsK/SpoIIIE, S-DNA-T family [Bifidobacterium bohemicum]|nr:type VII secretion protein EssC [Bifidobacterium bohemicum]SCC02641.1 DNA segregation ATPase FtsK/SpoIIIE, S-DNA-T family [Bifidobacterium bohemicum]